MGGCQTPEYTERLLKKLYALCGARVVLTGICFDETEIGAAVFDGKRTDYCFSEKISGEYPGAGDVFSSSFLTALLDGKSYLRSAQIAARYTAESIRRTKAAGTDVRFGLNFEQGIPDFIQMLKNCS